MIDWQHWENRWAVTAYCFLNQPMIVLHPDVFFDQKTHTLWCKIQQNIRTVYVLSSYLSLIILQTFSPIAKQPPSSCSFEMFFTYCTVCQRLFTFAVRSSLCPLIQYKRVHCDYQRLHWEKDDATVLNTSWSLWNSLNSTLAWQHKINEIILIWFSNYTKCIKPKCLFNSVRQIRHWTRWLLYGNKLLYKGSCVWLEDVIGLLVSALK